MCGRGPGPIAWVSVSLWQWRPWLETLVNAQESLEIGLPTHITHSLELEGFLCLSALWMKNVWPRAQPGGGDVQYSPHPPTWPIWTKEISGGLAFL